MRIYFLFAFTLSTFYSCKQETTKTKTQEPVHQEQSDSSISSKDILYNVLSPGKTGINFQNTINETVDRNILNYDYFYNGGGVALADFNNDGLTDVFFTGNDVPNKLYKNLGGLQFKDASSQLPKEKKWTSGVTVVDINNDGLQDLYLCNSGPDLDGDKLRNQLLINKGNFKFEDEAERYGIADNNYGVQAEFFDMDNDGDLDLWINNHGNKKDVSQLINKYGYNNPSSGNLMVNLNKLPEEAITKAKIQLYRNDNGKFSNISKAARVNYFGFSLGLSVADLNDDGYLDVYVANDYFIPDFVFFNNTQGGFTPDVSKMNHSSFYSRGSDLGDINNDGILDLMVVDGTSNDQVRHKTNTRFLSANQFDLYTKAYSFPRAYPFNAFQLGVGKSYFSEIAHSLNIAKTNWSWAPLFLDMNNDGHQDLYVTNGYLKDIQNPDHIDITTNHTKDQLFSILQKVPGTPIQNAIFLNHGGFEISNATSSASNQNKSFSNGAAYGDLDNDGDLDLVINNLMSTASILENKTKGNFLKIKLTGAKQKVHRHAKLILQTESGIQRRDYTFTRGYLSYMEPVVHFGLGNRSDLISLTIEWLDGTNTKISDLQINTTLEVDIDQINRSKTIAPKFARKFNEITNVTSRTNLLHKEDFHNDFSHENLLPHKYSSLGPALAIADLDNNKKSDLFLGGSRGHAAKLYLMSGFSFVQLSPEVFQADANYEDLGACFFDANGDGKLDLYVCSGGSTEVDEVYLQDRLYFSVKGGFEKASHALPKMYSSTQTVVPFDFDKDGDMDLFVGGRNKPDQYPSKAESYLLINDNAKFSVLKDKEFYKALPNMITSAETLDLNGDGWQDLVVVGEWTEPKCFLNLNGKKFSFKSSPELNKLKGWWYKVAKADLNRDGKMDLVLGNLGTNNTFKVTTKNPLKVYFNDFDKNGTHDMLLTTTYNGQDVPLSSREKLSTQLPFLNQKFQSYSDFASASLDDILDKSQIQTSNILETNYFKSIVLINKGGSFEIKELPAEAQFAPLLDLVFGDFNTDGQIDFVGAGNIFHTNPEMPSYDSSHGSIFYGKGDGTFDVELDTRKTGLHLRNDVKKIGILRRTQGYGIIAANNNNIAQLYFQAN